RAATDRGPQARPGWRPPAPTLNARTAYEAAEPLRSRAQSGGSRGSRRSPESWRRRSTCAALVSRSRSSQILTAHSHTNFGIKGTMANSVFLVPSLTQRPNFGRLEHIQLL